MADKPSRALVLYAAGHAALLPRAAAAAGKSHLDAFAARASCGFLSLRTPATTTVNDAGDKSSDTILELAQLLDVYDGLYPAPVDPQDLLLPKLSERFMGMRAAMVTNCPAVNSFAASLGFHVFGAEDFAAQSGSDSGGSKDTRVISRALGLLGFSDGGVQDSCEFDLVFVHVATESTAGKLGKLGMRTDLNRLDKLVAAVMEAAPAGSPVAARVHVSVVLSYGSATENKEESCLIVNMSSETDSDLRLLRPRQSYTMKAGNTLDDVRNHHPMLLAQWQEGVTRSDLAKEFSFEEFIKHAGNFAMLAERFLHEVAFKLWKAPKYGA
ncbi:uncharacterized protein [Lolium perenne]|uniref:uncharacterized protein isoform X1 n=1 Tax=Lolium perenne TaxID=4522 RepID=UPI0021F54499|nr:uncharacterized protein LOC127308485 [Lolium perenne]